MTTKQELELFKRYKGKPLKDLALALEIGRAYRELQRLNLKIWSIRHDL